MGYSGVGQPTMRSGNDVFDYMHCTVPWRSASLKSTSMVITELVLDRKLCGVLEIPLGYIVHKGMASSVKNPCASGR